jgi:hypothetical protein
MGSTRMLLCHTSLRTGNIYSTMPIIFVVTGIFAILFFYLLCLHYTHVDPSLEKSPGHLAGANHADLHADGHATHEPTDHASTR